ncbi:YicC/YloC family endoribonuclease [Jeotgalibacillus salarius]|uniref:YicC family protein n=1 Tax=Jeotgalibacillus salarius TaxID=546023 RepID=A0A4Y8LJE4_9BACL|nr:YicC/YloC family endoribonuclease [Jeotgalibacillus salarius]TFE02705.1 YicC family protein [Jeotgalibacillus salarius]
MTKSMTGFGRGTSRQALLAVTVEIKSVNHRFHECTVKMPRMYAETEEKVKKVISSYIKRGKVDVYVSVESEKPNSHKLIVDWQLLDAYAQFVKDASARYGIEESLRVRDLLKQTDAFTAVEMKEEHSADDAIMSALEEACKKLSDMRVNEGKELENELLFQVQSLKQKVEFAMDLSPDVSRKYKDRLEKTIREYTNGIDESRLLTEVAIFADKADVTEEFTRLLSHIKQFERALLKNEPIGRRLDFLTQEMHREVNTIGSKASDEKVAAAVIDMKSILEKIREQVQNIE